MARGIGSLILLLAGTVSVGAAECDSRARCSATTSTGEATPNPAAKPGKSNGSRKDRAFPGGGVDGQKAREAFRNMSPEERERWLRRFRDWADMPPEKKRSLADREEIFRRKIRE